MLRPGAATSKVSTFAFLGGGVRGQGGAEVAELVVVLVVFLVGVVVLALAGLFIIAVGEPFRASACTRESFARMSSEQPSIAAVAARKRQRTEAAISFDKRWQVA